MDLPQAWPSMDQTHPCYYYPHHHHYYLEGTPGGGGGGGGREHLFEKALTPSDVGKLNRLVIPKQHAERHFPLDGETGEKGLLLGFEDECGKPWRFRYSYWTSSQSYVLTKGWSRFVKDKRLDAGDVVLFDRCRANADRLYIGWRRRGDPPAAAPAAAPLRWGPVLYGTPQISSAEEDAAETSSKTLRLFGVNVECGHRSPLVEHQFLL